MFCYFNKIMNRLRINSGKCDLQTGYKDSLKRRKRYSDLSNIKALLVGVSNYNDPDYPNLSFCKNDLLEMKNALINGFRMSEQDIFTIGESGNALKQDFLNILLEVKSAIENDDIFIFYFSGHGNSYKGKHSLIFTDGEAETQIIIDAFSKLNCRSKIIFLDCCLSGNFAIKENKKFELDMTVEEFYSNGYAVFSSSNAYQSSFGRPDKPLSVFTSFLCDAIIDKVMVREGKKTLYDIQRLVSLYMDVWSKKNPNLAQLPIYRAKLGGTITFNVDDYVPYKIDKFYKTFDKYIIHTVEPLHNNLHKRYVVKVILREDFSLTEIAEISKNVFEVVKRLDVYNNDISKAKFINKTANLIFVHFGRDESDVINGTYICKTTWVDDKQDKKHWYKTGSDDLFFINDVHFQLFSYYEQLKIFRIENTVNETESIQELKELISKLTTDAEIVIAEFGEYINQCQNENELVEKIKEPIDRINTNYLRSTDIGIPNDSIRKYIDACQNLFGTIHDFSVYYSQRNLALRTEKNRRDCMIYAIKMYHSDLLKVKELEVTLQK